MPHHLGNTESVLTMNFQELVGIAFILLLLIFVFIKVNSVVVDNKQIRNLLTEFYANKEMKVRAIYKLNLSEKLKYGVIVNSILRIYSYFIPFYRINYFRKLEIVDCTENESTKYVEVSISNESLISCVEFDSYNF